jgi:hypothetical protein
MRPSRMAMRQSLVQFPGNDPARDSMLRQFLVHPIDSREPFSVPEFRGSGFGPTIRGGEPSDAVKAEWDSRLNRVRVCTRMEMRRPLASGVPDIAVRDLSRIPDAWNPYKSPTIEEVAGERSGPPQGPMLGPSKLPKLRAIPREYARAKAVM